MSVTHRCIIKTSKSAFFFKFFIRSPWLHMQRILSHKHRLENYEQNLKPHGSLKVEPINLEAYVITKVT